MNPGSGSQPAKSQVMRSNAIVEPNGMSSESGNVRFSGSSSVASGRCCYSVNARKQLNSPVAHP